MSNPLAQKAQYYLNESNRLSEELKSEQEYSELLESILVNLLNSEHLDESIKKKLLPAIAALGIGTGLGTGLGALTPEVTAIKNATNLMGIKRIAPPREESTKRGAMLGGALGAAALGAAALGRKLNK